MGHPFGSLWKRVRRIILPGQRDFPQIEIPLLDSERPADRSILVNRKPRNSRYHLPQELPARSWQYQS